MDFEVRQGEVFGLLGPNGSGKSTIIKMLLGLLNPTRGFIRIFDHSPRDVKTKERIGYLPEESYLYKYLNSEETDRKSTRLNSSHALISYAVFCLKKKNKPPPPPLQYQ